MKKAKLVLDYLNDALSCQEDFYKRNNGTMINEDLVPYSGQLSIIFRSLYKAKQIIEEEMAKKTLEVTECVPEDAVILLVDVQEQYFNEVTDYLEFDASQRRKHKIHERLIQMKKRLMELKEKGHKVYAIVDEEGIHPVLEGIPDVYLPAWAHARNMNSEVDSDPADAYILHPDIIQAMKQEKTVVVCGLWLELCVYAVTRLLQKEGIRALTCIDPALSLENAMIWDEDDKDVITLRSECEKHGIIIRQVG
jgi:hypothetical protein